MADEEASKPAEYYREMAAQARAKAEITKDFAARNAEREG